MKALVSLFTLSILISCDPGYAVYIANHSQNTVYVETDRAIESRLVSKGGPFYDSIFSKKISGAHSADWYQIKKDQNIFLFSYLGAPSANYFPFKRVRLINGADTIKVGKDNLMQKITKGKRSTYYINVN